MNYTGINISNIKKSSDEPFVTAISVTFDTTTNDKDHDTYLDISVFNNKGVILANKSGIGGHWDDHSTNIVSLDLKNALLKSQVPAGQVNLVIHPNGNDKWEFNYHIDIYYSDGNTFTQKNWKGKVLTQNNSSCSDCWNGY